MSELKVNKISPQSGTAFTVGDSGDTFTVPSGATLTVAGALNVTGTTALADGTVAVAELDIDGATDIGAAIVDADLFVIDDGAGGTNRKTAASRLQTYILGANSVDSDAYVDGSIDTAHIADDQVTLAKMAGLTRGKIIYGDSSGNPAALTVGSSGQSLTSDGTDISWGAGGAISTYTNSTNNRVVTSVDSSSVNSEANLTFDGSVLAVTGNVTASGTVEPAGDTAANDNAAIGYTSVLGLILTGQGSTNDVTIVNDADSTVMSVPTGTVNVTFAGTIGSGAITSTGIVTGTGFTAGSAVLAEAELEFLDGITAGTVSASKCLVVDGSKDLTALNDVRLDSLGVATAASGTSGEIRATNDITAFYSSDIALKENIVNIPSPMDLVKKINGVLFDWKQEYIDGKGGEDGYFVRKKDVGVLAQDVEKVLPEIVATRKDGMKAVKYDRLVSLLVECVKDLQGQVDKLKEK